MVSAGEPGTVDRAAQQAFVRHVERAVELGFVGDPEVEVHLDNARAFAEAIPRGARLLDLGSGGGLPGIALLALRPDLEVTLLDAQHRRCDLLRSTVESWPNEITGRVVEGRAENLARTEDLDGAFDVVVARLFGAPAVTAECAVRFLRPDSGVLLVSEPPDIAPARWPADGLNELGLVDVGLSGVEREPVAGRARIRMIRRQGDLPARYPRPVGRPAKRPLF